MPKYREVIRLAKTQVWAMAPEYMEFVCSVLTERAGGKRPSAKEVASRLKAHRAGGYPSASSDRSTSGDRPYGVDRGVALIPVDGVIMPKASYIDQISGACSLAALQHKLSTAIADEAVHSILLLINSPGGMVLGISEAEKAIRLAAKVKPVQAFVEGLCCSAAYWLASAADKIHAPITMQVGSIGVYRVHCDESGADAEEGKKFTYIYAGDRKVDGNPHAPLTGKAKASWQENVDEAYAMFTSTVMRNRRLSGNPGDATGQGASFYGERAKELGLIDSFASRNEVIEKLQAKAPPLPIGMVGSVIGSDIAATRLERPTEAAEPTDAAASIENIQGVGLRERSSLEKTDDMAAAAASLTEEVAVNRELKSLLYACGVIKSLDLDDAKCWDRLEGWAEAKGVSFSKEKQEEIVAYFQNLARGGALGTTEQNAQLATLGVERSQREKEAIERAAIARADEVRARAKVLCASGFVVGEAQVKEAIDKGWDADAAAGVWTRLAPVDQPEKFVPNVNVVQNELQAAEPLVSEALAVLMGKTQVHECKSREAAHLSRKGSMRLAEVVCEKAGLRVGQMDDEDIAKEFLRISAGPLGARTVVRANSFDSGESFTTDKAEGALPYYGAGSHPNLFANPAQRVLMDSLKVADTTYQLWSARMQDATKLGMEEGVGFAAYGELPAEVDGLPVPGTPMTSKKLYYIECTPYSDTIALTWQMVMRNQILDFAKALAMRQIAAVRTVNRAMIELLTSNPTMWDGYSLFDATYHFNNITSGAPPSITQLTKHDLSYGKQVDIDGQTEITVLPKYMLVPADLRVQAKQLEQFQRVQNNSTVDPTKLGVWQDLQVACDPMLRSYSQIQWYTFADPALVPCLMYQYLAGYGEGGKTTSWFDPETESQKWKVKIAFGTAAARFEGVTRDLGTGA